MNSSTANDASSSSVALPARIAEHRPVRIVHVITGLGTGGSETMLWKLLAATDRRRFHPVVVSLLARDPAMPIAGRIEQLGIEVRSLGMRRGIPDVRAAVRLYRAFRALRPRILQTWLMHADLLGGVVGAAARVPVVWNVRHSFLEDATASRLTRATERGCAALSGILPRKVICCSEASRAYAAALGHVPSKLVVIPNGFDLSVFAPDPSARESVRTELGLAADAPLVGLVARWDPNKDHRTFLQAIATLRASRADVHAILCGDGVTETNAALASEIRAAGVEGAVHLLGRRSDVPRLQAALDVGCSSSVGEGFPNVIGEAMACGVPCAVTDVGDARDLVGDVGRVVAPRDPGALAAAVRELLALDASSRRALGVRARARVLARYDITVVARRYEALYDEVIAGAAA